LDAKEEGARLSLVVIFLVFFVLIVVNEVAIFSRLDFFFLVVLFVQIIRDQVQMDGMRLRDLKLGFALGTTQDLAFFDFVFIDIDFGGTFRATNHGSILRRVVRTAAA
jgi:hypothetical protein